MVLDVLSRFDKPVSQRLVEGCHTYMAEFGKPAPSAHEWLLMVSAGQTIHETQKEKMKTNKQSKLWVCMVYDWFSFPWNFPANFEGLNYQAINLTLLEGCP